MQYLDNVKKKVGGVVGEGVGHLTSSEKTQSVTISRARDEVEQFWRDPDSLSAVFDSSADVRSGDAPGESVWTPAGVSDGGESWRAVLHEDGDAFRFTAAQSEDAGANPGFELKFREAPRGLGTEVSLRADTPLPDFLSSLAAFAVLYRARALLQTGEVPTLRDNPSARPAGQ